MGRIERWAGALMGAMLLAGLTSCTGSTDGTDGSPGKAGPEQGATTSPAPEPWRLPEGTPQVAWSSTKVAGGGDGEPSAIFTDDHIIMASPRHRLTVLDRQSLKPLWIKKIRAEEGEGACPLLQPATDATIFTVLSGHNCHLITTYDLGTGKLVAKNDQDRMSVGLSIAGRVLVASEQTISEVDSAGSLKPVFELAQAGIRGDFAFITALTSDSEELFYVETNDFEAKKFQDAVVAVRVSPDGLTVAWVQRNPLKGLSKLEQMGRDEVTGGLRMITEHDNVALWYNRRSDGYIGRWDPATATLADTPVRVPGLGRPNAKVPGVFTLLGSREFAIHGDTLVTGMEHGDRKNHQARVVAYDLNRGVELWDTKPTDPANRQSIPSSKVIRFSPDGKYVYATVTDGCSTGIREFEVSTGKQTRAWELDEALGGGCEVYLPILLVDGDELVAFSRNPSSRAVDAVVLRWEESSQ